MTVGKLREWLKGFDDSMFVFIEDDGEQIDPLFTTGTDEDMRPCIMIEPDVGSGGNGG